MADIPDRLTDALAGRYRIERLLGSGGMADVWLAQDLKHPRRVAIKVLKPEIAALLGRERFLREVELAARLQHPYILALWDSGVAGDLLYYVMPYLEGDTLRRRLEHERQLSLDDATRIAGEVAEALDYAHGQSVIHRDIKPENILFEGRHALVADFGIARALGLAGGSKLTDTGVSLGTPTYMSPEQAFGDKDLDGRSDQYSLGCVVYEMLGGQPPFTGATAESVVHQHLVAPPRPVTDLRPAVAAGAAAALARALSKAPADRFASAGEFARAVTEAWTATPDSGPSTSRVAQREPRRWRVFVGVGLVVAAAVLATWWWIEFRGRPALANPLEKDLVFVAHFDGPGDDPGLAPAVRTMIMAALDQSGIAATVPEDDIRAALRAAGKPDSTRVDGTVARELAFRRSIRAVLEGRVLRIGQGYSVITSLVDIEHKNRVLVSATVMAEDQNGLLPALDRLGHQLRRALGEQRTALRSSWPLWEVATPDFEAVRLFARWSSVANQANWPEAARILRAAIDRDPRFGAAWFQLGIALGNEGKRDSSRWAYEQALKCSGRLTDFEQIFIEFVIAHRYRRDLVAALDAVERGLKANLTPAQLPAFLNARGMVMASAGRIEDAAEAFGLVADQSDPRFGPNKIALRNLYLCQLSLGKFDEARLIAQQLTNEQEALARLEVVRERWAQAESLGMAIAMNPTLPSRLRFNGALAAASGSLAQGRVAGGTRIMESIRRHSENAEDRHLARLSREHAMSIALFSSAATAPLNSSLPTDTSLVETFSLVLTSNMAGRRSEARGGLHRLLSDPRSGWPEHAMQTALLTGWTAITEGTNEAGAAALRPVAFPSGGDAYFEDDRRVRHLARWLMAGLYEASGKPDSAAICLELMLAPLGRNRDHWSDRGFFFSFAHQRLVLLYARMGQIEPARRHWEAFQSAFTDPDPELRPLMVEARNALVSAEAVSRGTSR